MHTRTWRTALATAALIIAALPASATAESTVWTEPVEVPAATGDAPEIPTLYVRAIAGRATAVFQRQDPLTGTDATPQVLALDDPSAAPAALQPPAGAGPLLVGVEGLPDGRAMTAWADDQHASVLAAAPLGGPLSTIWPATPGASTTTPSRFAVSADGQLTFFVSAPTDSQGVMTQVTGPPSGPFPAGQQLMNPAGSAPLDGSIRALCAQRDGSLNAIAITLSSPRQAYLFTRPAGSPTFSPAKLLAPEAAEIDNAWCDDSGHLALLTRPTASGAFSVDVGSTSDTGWAYKRFPDGAKLTINAFLWRPDGTVVLGVIDGSNPVKHEYIYTSTPAGAFETQLFDERLSSTSRMALARTSDGVEHAALISYSPTISAGQPYLVQMAAREPGGSWHFSADLNRGDRLGWEPMDLIVTGPRSVALVWSSTGARGREYLTIARGGPQSALIVASDGSAPGTVSGAGAQCAGAECQRTVPGVPTRLNARPAKDAKFTGWSGACTGTSPSCLLEPASGQRVTAHFAPFSPARVRALTVTSRTRKAFVVRVRASRRSWAAWKLRSCRGRRCPTVVRSGHLRVRRGSATVRIPRHGLKSGSYRVQVTSGRSTRRVALRVRAGRR